MNEKYEFIGRTKELCGTVLHQIRAKKDFANVKKGEIGGWIEKESNLSVSGNAWVYGDAQVYGNAQVSDNAQVYGNAWVYGDAQVYGNAWVYGNARVSGDACVSDNARVSGNARVYGNARVSGDACVYGGEWGFSPLFIQGSKYSVCMYSPDQIKIGCQIHSINQWLSHGEKIARLHGFTPEEIEEYRGYVELAAKRYQTQNSKEEK